MFKRVEFKLGKSLEAKRCVTVVSRSVVGQGRTRPAPVFGSKPSDGRWAAKVGAFWPFGWVAGDDDAIPQKTLERGGVQRYFGGCNHWSRRVKKG